MHNVICGYCGELTKMVTSLEFYGQDYGTYVYSCKPCKAYVGSHKNSTTPLGTPANYELRELRKRTHHAIDGYWKRRHMSRKQMYRLLSMFLDIEPEKTHVGMFDKQTCLKVIKGFDNYVMGG